MMGHSAVRLHIVGMVQGVCFRMETKHQARALGLKGWVKNLPDGSVETYAEGDKKDLEALISWCNKGPSGANVIRVDAKWVEPEKGVYEFKITF